MNFGLSDGQRILQQAARDFFATECPPALVRQATGDRQAYPRVLYQKLARLGWLGVLVPEAFGGTGGSMLDAALLFEEAGRAALPGPLLAATLLAPLALRQAGSRSQKALWLPRLAAGDALGTLAVTEDDERYDAVGIRARARRVPGGYEISGVKMFVPDADAADVIIVAARAAPRTTTRGRRPRPADGPTLFLVDRHAPGVAIRPLETIDRTRRVYEVRLRDVRVPVGCRLGAEGAAWRVIGPLLDASAVAFAADSLGGADRALEMSIAYARTREQFGRPIGSFQAIKHMAAEMVSEIEPARSLVWYAAYAFDEKQRERSRAASLAKARLGDVYSRTTNRAVQIHGGIGFTWDHDLHWWFKRAKWNEVAFGDPTFHRERLATLDAF
jgi:alkylation response protein AidB-like acyl-CoA dehydrogenase